MEPIKYGVSGSPPLRQRPLPEIKGIKELKFNDITPVINQKKLVMIEFYTLTCSACRTFGATLAEAAEKLDGKVDMYRVEDPNLDISRTRFGIPGHPSTVFFYDGEIIGNVVGASPWHYFEKAVKPILMDFIKLRGQAMTLEEVIQQLPQV